MGGYGCSLLFANAWSQLLVSHQDLNCLFKFLSRRQRLAGGISNFNFSWPGQTTINQQCAVVRVIVNRGAKTARCRRQTAVLEVGLGLYQREGEKPMPSFLQGASLPRSVVVDRAQSHRA